MRNIFTNNDTTIIYDSPGEKAAILLRVSNIATFDIDQTASNSTKQNFLSL